VTDLLGVPWDNDDEDEPYDREIDWELLLTEEEDYERDQDDKR
jgi:hypothetical protein